VKESRKSLQIRAFVVALTGGISSGKTVVSNIFADLGAAVVDTDIVAREVVAAGSPGLKLVAKKFGHSILQADGTLDRKQMRDLIFSNSEKKIQLEKILHPLIQTGSIRQLQQVDTPLAILVIPLLAEGKSSSDSYRWVDKIVVVDVDTSTQIKRVMNRDNISLLQAKTILSYQASRSERLLIADDVIVNNKSIESLKIKVTRLFEQYSALTDKP